MVREICIIWSNFEELSSAESRLGDAEYRTVTDGFCKALREKTACEWKLSDIETQYAAAPDGRYEEEKIAERFTWDTPCYVLTHGVIPYNVVRLIRRVQTDSRFRCMELLVKLYDSAGNRFELVIK